MKTANVPLRNAQVRAAERIASLPANKKGNDQWYSDDAVPDPKDPPIAVGYRILVRPYPRRVKVGSLWIPDSNLEIQDYQNAIGRIVSIGPDAWSDSESRWAEVGDWVMFGKYAGTRFTYDKVRFVAMNDDDVIMLLPDANLFEAN